MFDKRATVNLMTVHDDCAGKGQRLAFPNVSSCAAVICVLDTDLVGIHRTQGNITGKGLQLFKFAKEKLIGGAKIHQIVIAGWNTGAKGTGHSATEIRNSLNAHDTPT